MAGTQDSVRARPFVHGRGSGLDEDRLEGIAVFADRLKQVVIHNGGVSQMKMLETTRGADQDLMVKVAPERQRGQVSKAWLVGEVDRVEFRVQRETERLQARKSEGKRQLFMGRDASEGQHREFLNASVRIGRIIRAVKVPI